MSHLSHSDPRLQRDEALLRTILIHGVPVRTVAKAMGVTRQTVYRRMEQARILLRHVAKEAERQPMDIPQILATLRRRSRRCRRGGRVASTTAAELSQLGLDAEAASTIEMAELASRSEQ